MGVNRARWREWESGVNFKLAIKISLAALLSWFICLELNHYLKHPDSSASGIWCVVASIVASQPTLGSTYKTIWGRFLGVLMGSLIGALFAYLLGAHVIFLGLALFSTVILSTILGLQDNYRIACLSVAVIMIPWGANPVISPWGYAFFRFLDTCIGLGTAVFIAYGVWPSQALTSMRLNMAALLLLMRQFYQHTRLLTDKDVEKEKILQELKGEINQAMEKVQANLGEVKIELLVSLSPASTWIDLNHSLERLWNHMRELEKTSHANLEEVFDEELKTEVNHISEHIEAFLKALAEQLKTGETSLQFALFPALETSLNEQMLRFRLTRATKNLSLDRVENYFIFFYNLKGILRELDKFHILLDELK